MTRIIKNHQVTWQGSKPVFEYIIASPNSQTKSRTELTSDEANMLGFVETSPLTALYCGVFSYSDVSLCEFI